MTACMRKLLVILNAMVLAATAWFTFSLTGDTTACPSLDTQACALSPSPTIPCHRHPTHGSVRHLWP